MNKARRNSYKKCPYGLNISRMSPLILHVAWLVYAESTLTNSLAVTRLVDAGMTYLEEMLLWVLGHSKKKQSCCFWRCTRFPHYLIHLMPIGIIHSEINQYLGLLHRL